VSGQQFGGTNPNSLYVKPGTTINYNKQENIAYFDTYYWDFNSDSYKGPKTILTVKCGKSVATPLNSQQTYTENPSPDLTRDIENKFCPTVEKEKPEEKPKIVWDITCNGSDTKPYKYGCKSDVIKQVQGCLGFTGDDVDGKFGTDTQTAINNKLRRTYFVTNDVATLCPPQQTEIGGGGTQDDIIKLPTKSAADVAKDLSQPISSTQTDQEEVTAIKDVQQATQEFNQGKGDLRKLKRVKRQLERILRRKDKFMDSQTKQTYQNSIADLDNKIKQLGG
jgi:hypothetical protein